MNVDVSAPWPRYLGSFTAEISEFLAHENSDYFWKYTELLCQTPYENNETIQIDGNSDKQAYITHSFNAAQSLIPQELHTLMDTVLGLSVYSPTVQFFQTLAESFAKPNNDQGMRLNNPCNDKAWAVIYPGGHIACDVETLNALMSDSVALHGIQDVTFGHSADASWDHRWAPAEHAKMHIVVYGALGTTSFCALHARAVSIVTSHKDTIDADSTTLAAYSARHAFPGSQPISNITRLQGFGVFLDIKNMEYKNVNDASAGSEGTTGNVDTVLTAASFPEGEEIAGVNLSTILRNYPDTDLQDLSVLRDELLEQMKVNKRIEGGGETVDEDISQMKLWKMKDLGVQAVHSILSNEVSVISMLWIICFECLSYENACEREVHGLIIRVASATIHYVASMCYLMPILLAVQGNHRGHVVCSCLAFRCKWTVCGAAI